MYSKITILKSCLSTVKGESITKRRKYRHVPSLVLFSDHIDLHMNSSTCTRATSLHFDICCSKISKGQKATQV